MIQPPAWAKTFLRLADGYTLNLLFYLWAIVIVAVLEENVSEWYELHCTIIQFLLDSIDVYQASQMSCRYEAYRTYRNL